MVISEALAVLESAETPGSIVHSEETWSQSTQEAIMSWQPEEPSPIIEDNVIIGDNSLIIGGIKVGKNSYIAAGSIICKDIPPNKKVIMHRTLKLSRR